MRRLRLEIEFPGFYADDCETPEDAEEAMQLASDDVIVVFSGHEGDQPGTVLRSLGGRIRVWRVAREELEGKA
jgi:hypothetical protein